MMASETLTAFLDRNPDVIAVRLNRVQGSCPREAGAEMLVAADDCLGTIGGGQLEYMVIDAARAMLAREETALEMGIPLGPEIGQCCGGRVEVALRRLTAEGRRAALKAADRRAALLPHVYVLGAGHVGRALARLLEYLPVRTIVVDSRAEELMLCTEGVELRRSAMPEADIAQAPAGSAFVVLTHDHALDFLLTAQALARGDAAYVGMIGSATKRGRFRAWCRNHCDGQPTDALVCPIGASASRDKRPEVIAAFVAAEVVAALTCDVHQTTPVPFMTA